MTFNKLSKYPHGVRTRTVHLSPLIPVSSGQSHVPAAHDMKGSAVQTLKGFLLP